jgi:hypothetical protein
VAINLGKDHKAEASLFRVKLQGGIQGPFTMNFIEGMVLAGVFPRRVEFQGIYGEAEDWQSLPQEQLPAVGVGSKEPVITYGKSASAWPLMIVLILTLIGLGIFLADKSSPADIPKKDRYKVYRPATPSVPEGVASSTYTPAPADNVYTDATGRTYRLSREDYNRLYAVKIHLDVMEREIEGKAKKLQTTLAELDLKKATLDSTDAAAVDAHNQLVTTTKTLDAELENQVRTFEIEAASFNKELERVGRPIR